MRMSFLISEIPLLNKLIGKIKSYAIYDYQAFIKLTETKSNHGIFY